MKIIAISDTHGKHEQLKIPDCDILIHAGDSNCGSFNKFTVFIDWLEKQPAKHKILIAGNHDWAFRNYPYIMEQRKTDVIYLQDSACEIEGVKFYGSPYTPEFCNWAFMEYPNELRKRWKKIPEDTDILITHGPPYGILDYCYGDHVGCEELYQRIKQLKNLKYHIFGHIHEGYGKTNWGGIEYRNVSVLDGQYQPYKIDWEINEIIYEKL